MKNASHASLPALPQFASVRFLTFGVGIPCSSLWRGTGPGLRVSGKEAVQSLERVILKTVARSLTTRSYVVAWLLCVIVSILTVYSPHCDVCDGFSSVRTSSSPLAHHHVPSAPDTCNGLCSCCALLGLPTVSPAIGVAHIALIEGWPERAWPAFPQASSVFRPPRISIS